MSTLNTIQALSCRDSARSDRSRSQCTVRAVRPQLPTRSLKSSRSVQAVKRHERQVRLLCQAKSEGEGTKDSSDAQQNSQLSSSGVPLVFQARYLDKHQEQTNNLDTVQMIKVRFIVTYQGSFGEGLRLVGGHEALGNWSLNTSISLTWSPGDQWKSDALELPIDGIFVYKYVLCKDGDPARPMQWQAGNNQVLALTTQDAPMIEVHDNWKGDPAVSYTCLPDGSNALQAEQRLVKRVREADVKLQAAQTQIVDLTSQLKRSRFEAMALREEARLGASARLALKTQVAAERERIYHLESQIEALRGEGALLPGETGGGREKPRMLPLSKGENSSFGSAELDDILDEVLGAEDEEEDDADDNTVTTQYTDVAPMHGNGTGMARPREEPETKAHSPSMNGAGGKGAMNGVANGAVLNGNTPPQSTNGDSNSINGASQSMNGASQSMNGASPPMNGASPPMNGASPPMNGASQSMNGASQSTNGASKSMNGASRSKNGASQSMNGSSKPMNGASQSMNGGAPSINGAVTNQPVDTDSPSMNGNGTTSGREDDAVTSQAQNNSGASRNGASTSSNGVNGSSAN
eukprot:CAMPEP_0197864844 /NCGR_PEP_ID=MMETSP1438-20131217/43321_1 /TAXON_ID=1461541 /ORGANISM="Pterosperma sp., Strain CCMP1384" /LENGTH=578 /DNA_ID=CAMNT_0043483217 /DNA_START=136 /DNA_END=1872 /DNA_ORIENTATION=+